MTMLDKREQALEQAFVRKEEVRFLMLSHRNKLFGRWAGDLLHYRGEVAERYITSMVDMTGKPPHGVPTPDDKIVSRVVAEFANTGMTMTPDEVRDALTRFEEQSRAEFGTAPGKSG
jgi:hypothetical protein